MDVPRCTKCGWLWDLGEGAMPSHCPNEGCGGRVYLGRVESADSKGGRGGWPDPDIVPEP